jgi:hypothetical protein
MTVLNLLVGMERSGRVRDALIALGHNAVSCDLKPSDRPGPHIKGNVFDHLDDGWDGAFLFPDCTYLTCSAEWAYGDGPYHQQVKSGTLVGAARREARDRAVADFNRLLNCRIPKKVIENPRGVISTRLCPPTQTIQPNWFGEDASKATCLWIRGGWPILVPTFRVPGRMVEWPRGGGKMVERWANQTDSGQNRLSPSEDRAAQRGTTYIGVATALAWQMCGLAEERLVA